VTGDIDSNSYVYLLSEQGDITIDGKIDGASQVTLIARVGSVFIGGKVDGNSQVSLAASSDVALGNGGGGGEDTKIDGSSQVQTVAGGNITVGSYIHKATTDFSAHGKISFGEIDSGATIRHIADGDIALTGKIDGTSRVELVSNRGSVLIDGKIDGASKVSLTAAMDIGIGIGITGSDDDHKIDGNSVVVAVSGNAIRLGSSIHKDATYVDFAAGTIISVGKDVSFGAQVRLLSRLGSITVGGGIADSGTVVYSFPPGVLVTPVTGGAVFHDGVEWMPSTTLAPSPLSTGYWWQNWPQTFGYVAPFRSVPRSVDEIATAVSGGSGVKAVGGGWSFTDASLPFATQAEVEQASVQVRGAWQRQDLRGVLEIQDLHPTPMDLLPGAVARNVAFSTNYDKAGLRQATNSGAQLPASLRSVTLIDTRSLASSLQDEFPAIRAAGAPAGLFHVEAGITMSDLQQLLDHQNPRLAVLASGGSPGATLAGAISTATHGGEFTGPLLVDTVMAIHLVGPGGEQWWIEGDVPVADLTKMSLLKRYQAIDKAHFIDASWSGIPGLNGHDVLKAVAVSMGSMGVIYSVVLAVTPQFGLQQIVHPTNWSDLLAAAGTNVTQLRAGIPGANQNVLNLLINGSANGTGISALNNVYVDLAVNPVNLDCWIVNRQRTPRLPDDANSPVPAIGDYVTALARELAKESKNSFFSSLTLGRIFDFLHWGTGVGDVLNDLQEAQRLFTFITRLSDMFGGPLGAASAQAMANILNALPADRGQAFIGDILSGLFHALEGTAPGMNSDQTGLSYNVGAIGWPNTGLPGRALEIALDPTNAFTFMQTVLFDDILANVQVPFIGYISVRVCPTTQTLLGMQQYSPFSVMIEVVSYRSPEAGAVMDAIQSKALAFSGPGQRPLLHWGLENNKVDNAFLMKGPLGQPFKGMTRLGAFTKIRQFLANGNPQVFNNAFTTRMGL
jgi:hypothetical protein